jgi:hypothetical protein
MLQEKAKTRRADLWESTQLEFNLIGSCETMVGALHYLFCFFEKIISIPDANIVIAQEDIILQEEDSRAFEALKCAFDWFYNGLCKVYSMTKTWEVATGHHELKNYIEDILNYNIPIGNGTYLQTMEVIFRDAIQTAISQVEYHPMLKDWVIIDCLPNGNFAVRELLYPEFVKQQICKNSFEAELYEWNGKVDKSFTELLRFLKILSQYDSFPRFDRSKYIPPKNFIELEAMQYQWSVGTFLDRFKSPDPQVHPLTLEQLKKRIKHFVLLLEQKMQLLPDNTENEPLLSQESKRTRECNADIRALIPYAQERWKQEITKGTHFAHISIKEMAKDIIFPKKLSLYEKSNPLPRMIRALKATDPRVYDAKGGACKGLKPHWEQFEWVDFSP